MVGEEEKKKEKEKEGEEKEGGSWYTHGLNYLLGSYLIITQQRTQTSPRCFSSPQKGEEKNSSEAAEKRQQRCRA